MRAAGRTPAAAVRAFLADIGRPLSCVTDAVVRLSAGGYRPAGSAHQAVLAGGSAVALQGPREHALKLRLRYVIREGEADGWHVELAGYEYALLGGDDVELLVWHWNPQGKVHWPHLHVGPGALRPGSELLRAHLPPRAPVRLKEVLALAIDELGVHPRRSDWRAVLGLDPR